MTVSQLNRLLTSLGPDRTWCCDRCREATLQANQTVGWKDQPNPGEPYDDLPGLTKETDEATTPD
jgi:hypothetical protein